MSTLFEAYRLIKIMLNDHNKILHAYMLHDILGLDDVYILRGKLSKAKAYIQLETYKDKCDCTEKNQKRST